MLGVVAGAAMGHGEAEGDLPGSGWSDGADPADGEGFRRYLSCRGGAVPVEVDVTVDAAQLRRAIKRGAVEVLAQQARNTLAVFGCAEKRYGYRH